MTPQDVLNRVVDNAFTYLEKGLDEVDSEINFSLLHFYGGVELAIKACLLNEDWKLVVQEPGDADWNQFLSRQAAHGWVGWLRQSDWQS